MPSLSLTPRGHLLFTAADGAFQPPAALSRRLERAFARGSGHGLLELGAAEVGTALPADFSYWRDFAARLVTTVCTHPDLDAHHAAIPAPALDELEALAAAAPPMTGAEYITAAVLEALWTEIAAAFRSELAESKVSVQEFLQRKSPAWHLVGRVHFNLAENRRDDEAPFAFLATYTTQLSTAGQSAAPAARPRAERIRRRRQQAAAALVAPAGAARRRRVSVAEGDGRGGRDLSPAAVDARRGVSTADRCSPPRGRRRHRARADRVAGEPSAAPAGHGHRRRQAAVGSRHRRAARLQDGRQPRRRTADQGGD